MEVQPKMIMADRRLMHLMLLGNRDGFMSCRVDDSLGIAPPKYSKLYSSELPIYEFSWSPNLVERHWIGCGWAAPYCVNYMNRHRHRFWTIGYMESLFKR